MPPVLIALMARWGVPARFREAAAVVAAIVAACALAGLLWGVVALWFRAHDARVIERARDKGNIEALQRQKRADDADATARAADDVRLDTSSKGRTDAIDANPADPYRALGCQRLRAAGKDRDADAAGCPRR